DDASPVVRLYLASALQRLNLDDRWPILELLGQHAEDANDQNLPLMLWYAAEPLVEFDPARALRLAQATSHAHPRLSQFLWQRLADTRKPEVVNLLLQTVEQSRDASEQLVILNAVRQATAGGDRAEAPQAWKELHKSLQASHSKDVRRAVLALGVLYGDPAALEHHRAIVRDPAQSVSDRQLALTTLLNARDPKMAEILRPLLHDQPLRIAALQGLAQYNNRRTPFAILAVFGELSPPEKRLAIACLASRATYALPLLESVRRGEFPKAELSADLVMQLHNLRDRGVDQLLEEVWGHVRSSPQEKVERIQQYRDWLARSAELGADLELGRAVFAKTCQQCHVLFGVGSDIGPDLTGGNRTDAEFLLANIVDPGATMAKEYQTTVVTTDDGRVLTGIAVAQNDQNLTLQTATERVLIPLREIEDRKLVESSMMPDDQLKQFSPTEVASLLLYLASPVQVPLPVSSDPKREDHSDQAQSDP
ncbi:MAG TPA: dehydrogenase, partial [Pirellulaceae bacterium]